ncbi:uncharacterized protein LOC123406318 isoform X2 [Hordeum vulgare subsp. vulgare]|uniref:uncharacterized protein LOC123406318 isoform X2 n=1 Tax=Hordeum vulgare subsp. vulgare TaxID=112509 RepID=UPI001D1A4A0A|nr:uncharacterized protein LOC123406318 isoform X2 [Hordeum vulgare subsp. vulgare]XP_044955741.1 uncharacterized protein LOC123406318 isoform X2 [Hordeum vulgare subsp. vulgare]XP_044955742.1 uncharacterized protein LOC123406318 isoform X2 [Hordeum vulgare subsp. vulgare]
MLVLLRPNQAQLTLADTADAGASRDLPRPPWRGDASWPLSTARTGWSASATDIKGTGACEVKVPQANCAKNERIFCNNCRTSIVDFHRSCTKCSYDLCLICCRELRLGRCPGGAAASNMVLTQPEVEGKEDLQQTRSDDNGVSQKIPDGENGLLRNSAVPVEDSAAAASSMVLTQPEVEGKEDLQQTSSDDNSVSQKLSDGQEYKGYTTRAEAEVRYARYLAGERRERWKNRMKTSFIAIMLIVMTATLSSM